LLLAYPDDQRLIKAKTLLDKLPAAASSGNAAAAGTPPASNATSAQPTANDEKLTGMDKVDYNALIELARQAQQTTDLSQQRASLKQFMDQSALFLQKHPEQMVLWQLRAASAIGLNEPMEGYEAGQKLLEAGGADSNDPNLQQLLGQLKNKGWLDKQEAEKQAKKKEDYTFFLGTWSNHLSIADHKGHEIAQSDTSVEVSKSDSVLEGYSISRKGKKDPTPWMRGTILDSGEISWERGWGSDWKPVTVEIDNDMQTMKIVVTESIAIGQRGKNANGNMELFTHTNTLSKNSTNALTKAHPKPTPK